MKDWSMEKLFRQRAIGDLHGDWRFVRAVDKELDSRSEEEWEQHRAHVEIEEARLAEARFGA